MFDPFKRMRSQSRKTLRRSTLSAMSGAWDALLSPAKPAKRRKPKPGKPSAKASTSAARKRPPARGTKTPGTKKKNPQTIHAKTIPPRGAKFSSGTFANEFGNRSYRLYVPAAAASATDPMPLLVMLHGCGQSSEKFARDTGMNTLAEEFGFVVLYPGQARDAHQMRCWNWYRREDQGRGRGEPALIAGLTRLIIENQNIDPARVYIAGLSAGAAASLVLGTTYPDIFAAVGVHSGLAFGAAQSVSAITRTMQQGNPGQRLEVATATIIFHGDADKVVHPRNGRFVAIRALEPYGSLERSERTGSTGDGRKYTRVQHRVGKGRPYVEQWTVHGAGHAWSGGVAGSVYTDPKGPDASRAMVQFFLRHRTTKKRRKSYAAQAGP